MSNLVSPLILINRLNKNRYFNIFKLFKKIIYSVKDLIKITVKSKNKKAVNSISPHSKRIVRTKRKLITNKINKPALNRILKAYPSYIRVFGII